MDNIQLGKIYLVKLPLSCYEENLPYVPPIDSNDHVIILESLVYGESSLKIKLLTSKGLVVKSVIYICDIRAFFELIEAA
jgi:hypothetical protein